MVATASPALALYYDGSCPFCRVEMARLSRWNAAGRLAFVDIAAPAFDPAPLGVTMARLDREMMGRSADGRILWGLDAICAAYVALGQGWRIAPLRLPWVRRLLAPVYRFFARHRIAMSRLLGYRAAFKAPSPQLMSKADPASPACEADHCDVRKIW